jgi:HSP20 family protein
MALPGVDPKDVDVELAENVLTVKGERKIKTNDENSYVSEFGHGAFTRSFRLPTNIDAEKVVANFEHGMLELRLPLAEAAKPRQIRVTSAA